jgi:hypothetical protein
VDLEDEGREACVHGAEEETEASDEHKRSEENQPPEWRFWWLDDEQRRECSEKETQRRGEKRAQIAQKAFDCDLGGGPDSGDKEHYEDMRGHYIRTQRCG